MLCPKRPRIALVSGFFDAFSGYQEVGLAKALSEIAEVTVITSNWVNPIFSEDHLRSLGAERRYAAGRSSLGDIEVIRLESVCRRSMVWSRSVRTTLASGCYELIVQVTPGTLFPAAASTIAQDTRRVVLYGDNRAMYATLTPSLAALKLAIFGATKGALYRFVNSRADRMYGYTPNTVKRLHPFTGGRPMSVLPLGYDENVFSLDSEARANWRNQHAVEPEELVIIAAGKVQVQKRFDAVIEAVRLANENGLRTRLAIVGIDGYEQSRALTEFARQQLGKSVILQPFQDATGLNRAFNGADIGVWPAMPAITIQQAMGTGLYVVIPGDDTVSHLIRSPLTGLFIQSGKPLVQEIHMALRRGAGLRLGIARNRTVTENSWLSMKHIARQLLLEVAL